MVADKVTGMIPTVLATGMFVQTSKATGLMKDTRKKRKKKQRR